MGLEKIDLNDYPKVEVLGVNCTGLGHLPWKQIKERGIKVISLGINGSRSREDEAFMDTITSTAEHTIGLILALSRNYKTALNEPYKDREEYKGHTLAGKELGIIGYGRVGRQVAMRVRSFGMILCRTDTSDNLDNSFELKDLLEQGDIITLHIPLVGNEGFFTKEMFKLMKPTSYLINTSRDKIIEKGALVWALENKLIAGAAVDFIDDPELVHYARDHNNLILTPHLGGATIEDMAKTEEYIAEKIKQYIKQ